MIPHRFKSSSPSVPATFLQQNLKELGTKVGQGNTTKIQALQLTDFWTPGQMGKV